jgi:phage/plasmid-like protein (TIGR03299 family)
MTHELDIKDDKASLAYTGPAPWHGLGQNLTENASMDVWKKEAGMDWEIKDSNISFQPNANDSYTEYKGLKALYRSDSKEQLSVVSDEYKVVQPGDVLDFFQDLVSLQKFKLSTAGCLYGGRIFWALADTGREFNVFGKDKVKGSLLLTTSCDGKMATKAMFTSVRVVCNNTLAIALKDDPKSASRVTHSSSFNPAKVKMELGVFDASWEIFKKNCEDLSKVKLADKMAEYYIRGLLEDPKKEADEQSLAIDKNISLIMERYKGGMGSEMTYGTLWGVLNGVTEYVDHGSRARIKDHALSGSWFGKGAELKIKAYNLALEMI